MAQSIEKELLKSLYAFKHEKYLSLFYGSRMLHIFSLRERLFGTFSAKNDGNFVFVFSALHY